MVIWYFLGGKYWRKYHNISGKYDHLKSQKVYIFTRGRWVIYSHMLAVVGCEYGDSLEQLSGSLHVNPPLRGLDQVVLKLRPDTYTHRQGHDVSPGTRLTHQESLKKNTTKKISPIVT